MDQTVAASGAPGSLADPGASGSEPATQPGRAARLSGPGVLRGLRRVAGIVPFGVYVTLGLVIPMIAVGIGAFQKPNGGGFTMDNIKTATSGVYLHGFEQSIILSVVTAILPGIFGLLIAYAIFTARRGAILRRVAITASGVFANFGGVPLAFLFIATIGSSGLVTQWLSDLGFNPYDHGFNLYDLGGVAIVYMYFQIPSPGCCCWMSRCPRWTPRCGCSCGSRSARFSTSSAPPPCSSPTTRRKPCPWPTGWGS